MNEKMKIIYDKKNIIDVLSDKSDFIIDYIESTSSEFVLYYKYITHSDIPTFAKATSVNKLENNLLYYLTSSEMKMIEERNNRPFETAKQSNIGLTKSFWFDIGMEDPRINVDYGDNTKIMNNFCNIYLVNETLEYFTSEYTYKVFNKLNKIIKNKNEWTKHKMDLTLDHGSLTEVQITQAVHGMGTTKDNEFRKLRHNLFKNDIIYLLIEKNITEKNNLFIIPSKNPTFFTVIGESNYAWEKYKIQEQKKIERYVLREDSLVEEDYQTRIHQDKWRSMLADELKNYTNRDDEVFCPLTGISTDFESLGTIFRASHIKSYATSTAEEKYDINNGLLLIANADALFDKHLITISEQKEIIFSFLIINNRKLINDLHLSTTIFKEILNDKRMEFISHHRKIFYEKEEKRKQ